MTTEPNKGDYSVGWICAIPVELAAVLAILDEIYPQIDVPDGDTNLYKFGRIGRHNIVISWLPEGRYGVTRAGIVAAQMRSTFTKLRFGLMVGVGGGAPSENNDIRLGDLVISQPTGASGGVIQYDFGKSMDNGEFLRIGSLNAPPSILLTAVASIKAGNEAELGKKISDTAQKIEEDNPRFRYPGQDTDRLFRADYIHVACEGRQSDICKSCDTSKVVPRSERQYDHPYIHYGIVASGNQVMKDGMKRDKISTQTGAVCFEMEAAGLMDDFPCLVIRGICDYSDGHKNKHWQPYAALVAAIYAKELLLQIPATIKDAIENADTEREKIKEVNFVIPFHIPFPRNRNFVGRMEELRQIYDYFLKPNPMDIDIPRVFALTGTGGMGKTQIALEYAYRYHRDYTALFWVSAASEDTIRASFIDIMQRIVKEQARVTWPESTPDYQLIALKLGIPGLIDSEGTVSANLQAADNLRSALFSWLRMPSNSGWLLILDNADDLETFDIAEYLPNQGSGAILITSRRPEFSWSANQADLDGLDAATTWEISFSKVEEQDKEAALLLLVCSYLNPEEILDDLWADEQFYKDEVKNKILLLASYSLVKVIGFGVFAVHPVVHSWARERSGQSERFKAISDAIMILGKASHRVSNTSNEGWGREDKYDEAIQWFKEALSGVTKILGKDHPSTISILNDIAMVFHRGANYNKALQWFLRAHVGYVKAFGKDHPLTLTVVNNIALVSSSQGNYTEAMWWHEIVLAGCEKALLSKDHPLRHATIGGIAKVHFHQGKYDEAMRWYMQALHSQEKTLGKEHPSTLEIVNNVAVIASSQGKHDEAIQWYERLLASREKEFGRDHRLTLTTATHLAGVLCSQGKYDEALRWHERVLASREKVLGKEHMITLDSVINIAIVFVSQGKYDEAIPWYQRALSGREKGLGKDHRITLAVAERLRNMTRDSPGKTKRRRGRLPDQQYAEQGVAAHSVNQPSLQSPSGPFFTAPVSNGAIDTTSSSNAIGTALQLAQKAIEANNKSLQATVVNNNKIFHYTDASYQNSNDNTPPLSQINASHSRFSNSSRPYRKRNADYGCFRRRGDYYRPIYNDSTIQHGRINKHQRYGDDSQNQKYKSKQQTDYTNNGYAGSAYPYGSLPGGDISSTQGRIANDIDENYSRPAEENAYNFEYGEDEDEDMGGNYEPVDAQGPVSGETAYERLEEPNERLQKEIAQGLAWVAEDDGIIYNG
ncbi:hypothetical protein Dda_0778 [Drechslerella dactyloides]|uniref:Nucleoside phosphorylase domain-containing protein n=1 Tax=Drechslerella dactyloides TaxID=74499 RepID=A0AAD6J561_DREDA|nr:hypothetical protein Dda_0778 [Drechslerella dactyloides]